MRYIKLFEEFIYDDSDMITKPKIELSNTTPDDILFGNFKFDDEEDEEDDESDPGSFVDSSGKIHIKNWKEY